MGYPNAYQQYYPGYNGYGQTGVPGQPGAAPAAAPAAPATQAPQWDAAAQAAYYQQQQGWGGYYGECKFGTRTDRQHKRELRIQVARAGGDSDIMNDEL